MSRFDRLVGETILVLSFAVLWGCGGTSSDYGSPAPQPAPDTAWANTVGPLVQKDCGGCHNGTKEPAFTSGAQFKVSQAKALLTSGAMPKSPATISDADKQTLLAYLGS